MLRAGTAGRAGCCCPAAEERRGGRTFPRYPHPAARYPRMPSCSRVGMWYRSRKARPADPRCAGRAGEAARGAGRHEGSWAALR